MWITSFTAPSAGISGAATSHTPMRQAGSYGLLLRPPLTAPSVRSQKTGRPGTLPLAVGVMVGIPGAMSRSWTLVGKSLDVVGTTRVLTSPLAVRREKRGAAATAPPITVRISKWLGSGVGKSPPQRPPCAFQSVPSRRQKSGVVEAGRSPTRRSPANAGHWTCRLCGSVGLIRACN